MKNSPLHFYRCHLICTVFLSIPGVLSATAGEQSYFHFLELPLVMPGCPVRFAEADYSPC